MTRVFLADPLVAERSAFRVLLLDLRMELVGETSNWLTLYAQAGAACPDMILLSWELLPKKFNLAMASLRKNCPEARIVIIVNQAINSQGLETLGADAIISKDDFPRKVAEILRLTVENRV
jgi:DNA-binding NarL/FixJ family response regulator